MFVRCWKYTINDGMLVNGVTMHPTFQLTYDSSFPVEWDCLLGFSLFFFLLSFLLYSSVIWCIVCSSCFHLLNRTGSDFKKICCWLYIYDLQLCCVYHVLIMKNVFFMSYSECERFFFWGDKMISFYLKIYTN